MVVTGKKTQIKAVSGGSGRTWLGPDIPNEKKTLSKLEFRGSVNSLTEVGIDEMRKCV